MNIVMGMGMDLIFKSLEHQLKGETKRTVILNP